MTKIPGTPLSPIDDRTIPAVAGVDPNYLTRDLMSRLERAAFAKVHRVAAAKRIPLREAAVLVAEELEG
jgi:hypothetical protein